MPIYTSGSSGVTTNIYIYKDREIINPQTYQGSAFNLAPSTSTTIAATDITEGRTGYLADVWISASVPLKAEIKKVSSGVSTTLVVLFHIAGQQTHFHPSADAFYSQAGGANCHFAVTLTNMDTANSADVYVTINWDERA